MNRHFLDTPLGQVHYIDRGLLSAEPVVLLHQTPRSLDEFTGVIDNLSPEFRVIAMDTPGYGDSDNPPFQPSIADYTRIVILLLDHLSIQKAHLVGHHTGSFLAIEAGAAYPERVGKMVISGPHYMDVEEREKMRKFFQQWRVHPDGSHLTEKWNRFSTWIPDPQIRHRCLLDLLKAGETSEYGHFAAGMYLMEERLPVLKGPALIIIGQQDPFSSTEKCRIFVETIPDSREVLIPEGGIFMPTEMPERYAGLVSDFLKDAEPLSI